MGSKIRSLGQILEKPCGSSWSHIFGLILIELGQNVYLDKISGNSKLGYVGSKTRSLSQILEKPCVRSRCHIFESNTNDTWTECLPWWSLGQVWNQVMLGQSLGH